MTARAEAISCSETRPSALAMCPMTRKVVGKNSSLTCFGSAPPLPSSVPTVAPAVELMADERAQHRSPRAQGRQPEHATDDFSNPVHGNMTQPRQDAP
jgi:hypothetical protein